MEKGGIEMFFSKIIDQSPRFSGFSGGLFPGLLDKKFEFLLIRNFGSA
jgi:hypothetical protein